MTSVQPMCDRCWAERVPNGQPVRDGTPHREQCAFCGEFTWSGIYVRTAETVPFPWLGPSPTNHIISP